MLNIHSIHSDQILVQSFFTGLLYKCIFELIFTHITVARTQYVGTICYHSTGDSLRYHREMMFFTYDRDNDIALIIALLSPRAPGGINSFHWQPARHKWTYYY